MFSPNRAGDASKVPGLTGWLQLAATPTFAALALANALAAPAYMLCSAGYGVTSLGGMTLMYALMGVFHAGPWCKLVMASRCGARIESWLFRGRRDSIAAEPTREDRMPEQTSA